MSAPRRPALQPGPYLVVGLARSGAAVLRLLAAHGEVVGCDSGEPAEATALRDEGFEVRTGTDGVTLLDRAHTVVKSPGVPNEAAVVATARERGLEVTGELEVAWRLVPNEFVAVTGTNGKTTTVELLGEMHRAAGLPVEVAGNVGTPVASLAGRTDPSAVVVCEASSFQLEDSSAFAPECAVLLNVAEDHLDRHGSVQRYRAAKLRVFANQGGGDVAVAPAGFDLPPGAALRVSFGSGRCHDLADEDGALWWKGERLVGVEEIALRGAHNRENAMAAAAAGLARGIQREAVVQALRTFNGVEHRLEDAGERGGVLFVNDSKATNVAAARVGIEAFPGGVHVILGGSLKGGGFGGLREALAGHCRAAYLIGAAAEAIDRDIQGAVEVVRCGDLEGAVAAAAEAAEPGEVVLLSPACASFDAYSGYEQRGRHFKALVGAIPER